MPSPHIALYKSDNEVKLLTNVLPAGPDDDRAEDAAVLRHRDAACAQATERWRPRREGCERRDWRRRQSAVRRRYEAAAQGRERPGRRREVQDLRMRRRRRQQQLRHRADPGQDSAGGAEHLQPGHQQEAEPTPGEAALQPARRGGHQGGAEGLRGEEQVSCFRDEKVRGDG